ncbi:MAG TPA: hypothetical protein VG225_10385 [Terracidiphilus sp.]|nr:hypothetical protein [Terracidiphilus sp.]
MKPLIALLACLTLCGGSSAQKPNCKEIAAIGEMARAVSPVDLRNLKQIAGDYYRARLIFAARMLEIDRSNKSAAANLLKLIPKDEASPEQAVWLDLLQIDQDPHRCLPDSDLKPLGLLQYHLPRLLARAVLLAPDRMPDYVAYALISTCPDCDFAFQMREVCLAKHREFVSAVDKLSPDDKKWFVSKLLNPIGCRTLMFPEQ